MSIEITNNKYNSSYVNINVGTEQAPAYYSINKESADKFYSAFKKQEKKHNLISDIGIFSSVGIGYYLVSNFAKNLSSVSKFIMSTIGGISLSLITVPLINNYLQGKKEQLARDYKANFVNN